MEKLRLLLDVYGNRFIFLLILLCAGIGTYATALPPTVVKGRITDTAGNALAGATILVKGTRTGTSTNENGEFSIQTPKAAGVLVISYTGFTSREVSFSGDATLDIRLSAADNRQSDIVVVGYGTQKKGDLTAPITSVNMDDVDKRTTATPMDALQGSVPGVQVISNGSPGTSPEVRIRGIGSFNNENPLYVVDGMFVTDIGFLNSDDIADISVLKDASGAAIYGVEAANGVVLITTKKGRLNMKTRVTYNGYVGIQVPTHKVKMANGQQFTNYALQWQDAADSGSIRQSANLYGGAGLAPTTSTDWYKQILRSSAPITNQAIDVQGGSDKIAYTLGGNYLYQGGIMQYQNSFQRYNIRFSMDVRAFSWLKLGITTTVSNSVTFYPNNAAWETAFTASPLFPVYDSANNPSAFPIKFANSALIGRTDANAVAQARYNYNQYKQIQVLPGVYGELYLWHNRITLRSQLSEYYTSGLATNYAQQVNLGPGSTNTTPSMLTSSQDRNTNYILDNLVTYRDGLGRHHWSVLLGQSSRSDRYRVTTVQAQNVPAQQQFWYVTNYTRDPSYYSDNGTYNTSLSYFTRGTYDFDNKYLLTATFRKDGSSKYQQKWGDFPSLGVGWVISKEDFLKNVPGLDFLKLRGSWGKLGNDGVTPNAGYAIVNSGNAYSGIFGSTGSQNGQYVPGYQVNNFYSNVSWEVVTEWDGGIDFELLKHRLKGSADYYNRATNGAALNESFPFGAPAIYGNFADMTNKGFDFALSWGDRIGKLGYLISANASTLKNTVTKIGSISNIMGGVFGWAAEYPNIIQPGLPINSFYGYKTAGIYQTQQEIDADPVAVAANKSVPGSVQPGFFKYADLNHNGVRDAGDETNLGSYLPKVTYGFNISVSYRQFDFSVAAQGVAGNKILNLNRGEFQKATSSINLDQKFMEHLWTGPGSTNMYPSAYALSQPWNKEDGGGSFFVESGAYLRIQNIQLGYNFKLGTNNPVGLRVFVTADRPFIFTKYSGFTPEISGIGYDNQVYPVTASYSFGVKATF
ncbi:MAG TPA: SusC/RagA family TonB-linked outer membrane protein [Dinghuibacter sp.]|uniref:SusC/RagA family TonB-linked outer membrane protein n=1 Tax=Dinghuibacter sp. TaxID=2024697 RepID=UPI002BB2BC5C|nr:SusC/RagA family TonB-linked outer membrane protein [Dinghuibacter sp.]HTJ13128.1 SusC/RagA family TonB-linked outer membrane protein [Dinghuibacter sp.]